MDSTWIPDTSHGIWMALSICRVVHKLRNLMICHDRAVQQMQLIGLRLSEVDRRRSLYQKTNPCVDDVSLSLREQVLEGMMEAYKIYRVLKWREIQVMINLIFESYTSNIVYYILQTATLRREFFVDSDASDDNSDLDNEGSDIEDDFREMWIDDTTEMRMEF